MPIVVHLRNGQVTDLRAANSCSWSPASSTRTGSNTNSPRWLVCRNQQGDIVATYQESEVIGYQIRNQPSSVKRFTFPALRKSAKA